MVNCVQRSFWANIDKNKRLTVYVGYNGAGNDSKRPNLKFLVQLRGHYCKLKYNITLSLISQLIASGTFGQ